MLVNRMNIMSISKVYVKALSLLTLIFSLWITAVQAEVKAVGLMPGTAILEVNGQTRVLKQGNTSPEGIKLIQSNSRQAVIEMDGKRQVLGLGTSLASGYREPARASVRLSKGQMGHYWANGRINGTPIKMLVDTGASNVAISGRAAASMGISYRKGRRSKSSTAAGIVDSFQIVLDKVQVGDVTLHNVAATVIEGAFPEQPLLGMSFLGRLNMTEDKGMLLLTKQ